MIYLSLLFPFITIAILQIWWRHKVAWWEITLPLIPSIIIIPVSSFIGYRSQVIDYERRGSVTVKVEYYEDWDEYIYQTCTRTVSCGKDCTTTETYDCSYVDYHPAYWLAHGIHGETVRISQSQYNWAIKRFGNQKFVDLHRNYDSNDGDKYVSYWDRKDDKFIPLFTTRSYYNKVLPNTGLFEFKEISEEEKKGLFDWPTLKNEFYDPCILGRAPNLQVADSILQKFNAVYGKQLQIRVWVLLFNTSNRERAFLQRDYWKGVNKNELVVCIGKPDNKIAWCEVFCWSPDGYAGNHTLRINIRDFVEKQDDIDLVEIAKFIPQQCKEHWKRKSFIEFDYLSVPIPKSAIIFNYVLTILGCMGIGCYICNNYENKDW